MADQTATPDTPTVTLYNKSDWVLATLKWSPKWADSETDEKGSPFFIAGNSTSDTSELTIGKAKAKVNRVFFSDDKKKAPPVVQLDGGKAMYQILIKKGIKQAYINTNQSYTGVPLMFESKYDGLVKNNQMVELTSVAGQA